MQIFPGMACGEDVPLFGHGDMRIDGCDVDGTVSKHFLNIADIHIGFQQTGGECMAKHMRRNVQVDSCQRSVFVNHSPDRLIGQGCAVMVCKKMPAAFDLRQITGPVVVQNLHDRIVYKLQLSFFRPFAIDEDRAVI